jgi:hypothetical protein
VFFVLQRKKTPPIFASSMDDATAQAWRARVEELEVRSMTF